MVACAVATATSATNFPSLEDAQELFRPYLPCCQKQLRRVYLRLALQYHPDKCLGNLKEATELFQAIAAVYEQLSKAEDGIQRRVKSQVAAAAELGEIEELERLLLEDPQRSVEVDDLGVCPLMFAAAGGHLDAIKLLLSYGADVNAKNPIHWTVMLYACLGNHADVVRWLGRTAGVKVTTHELVLTAYTGNSQALASLIELYEGSLPELRTENGKSLLHLACEGLCFLKRSADEHLNCMEQLLAQGIPVDQAEPTQGRTCLQNLVSDVRWHTRKFEDSAAHMLALDRLCEAGASVVAEDFEGKSALSAAEESGLPKMRQLLFSYI